MAIYHSPPPIRAMCPSRLSKRLPAPVQELVNPYSTTDYRKSMVKWTSGVKHEGRRQSNETPASVLLLRLIIRRLLHNLLKHLVIPLRRVPMPIEHHSEVVLELALDVLARRPVGVLQLVVHQLSDGFREFDALTCVKFSDTKASGIAQPSAARRVRVPCARRRRP